MNLATHEHGGLFLGSVSIPVKDLRAMSKPDNASARPEF